MSVEVADRGAITFANLTVSPPPEGPADWNELGYVVIQSLLPGELIYAYQDEWWRANGWPGTSWGAAIGGTAQHQLWENCRYPGGWSDCTPYMRYSSLMDLCTYGPLQRIIELLIGEPAGVHLNLTGWVSTERDWHQDTYLNPPEVGDYYCAVWMCLDDVHPDSGPFEIVDGSHRWPVVTREKILAILESNERGPDWPKHSERILTPLFESEIEDRAERVHVYLPKRGDVLLWHGRAVHRGSRANIPGMYRGACIAHYSGIHHRSDMPPAVQHVNGGWYFPIVGGPVR